MLKKYEAEANRLSISVDDFDQSIRFLTELISWNGTEGRDHTDTVRESLLLSAIISYSRPFSHNEKGNAVKADPRISEQVLDGLSGEEFSLHQRVRNLRNKAIAHSEWAMSPKGLTTTGVYVGVDFTIWRHLCQQDIAHFLSLVKKIRDRTHDLRGKHARRKVIET